MYRCVPGLTQCLPRHASAVPRTGCRMLLLRPTLGLSVSAERHQHSLEGSYRVIPDSITVRGCESALPAFFLLEDCSRHVRRLT